MKPFELGVNYWPRRSAMSWWSQFDAAEVRDDFALLKNLGMSMVRIFLLWDDWQPAPDAVLPERLRDLITVCNIAAANALSLNITFFTGHMSGPNWSPRWLLDPAAEAPRQVISAGRVVSGGYRNPFTDPMALEAEDLLLRTVVGALHDHEAIAIWNLGNEPDLFAVPPSAAAGRAWVRDRVATIRALDPVHNTTCGLHIDSLQRDNGLRVDHVFAETDLAVMHAYPMYLSWGTGPLDPDLVPYTCAVTSALSGKPTLMEEFGGCTTGPGLPSQTWSWPVGTQRRTQFMASEEALATYVEAVLPRLVDVGATGALVWCFADYVPALWDRPPCDLQHHERFFGLTRPDGSLKPHADVLRRFAATEPMVERPARTALEPGMTPDEYYTDPLGNLVRGYEAFKGLASH